MKILSGIKGPELGFRIAKDWDFVASIHHTYSLFKFYGYLSEATEFISTYQISLSLIDHQSYYTFLMSQL